MWVTFRWTEFSGVGFDPSSREGKSRPGDSHARAAVTTVHVQTRPEASLGREGERWPSAGRAIRAQAGASFHRTRKDRKDWLFRRAAAQQSGVLCRHPGLELSPTPPAAQPWAEAGQTVQGEDRPCMLPGPKRLPLGKTAVVNLECKRSQVAFRYLTICQNNFPRVLLIFKTTRSRLCVTRDIRNVRFRAAS